MKVIMIGGYCDKDCYDKYEYLTGGKINVTGNIYQELIFEGFNQYSSDVKLISMPNIGVFPSSSRRVYVNEFSSNDSRIIYIPYVNIFGLRNPSRYFNLKKQLREELRQVPRTEKVIILVFSIHSPFLVAACKSKKRFPNVSTVQYVLDLPEFMVLNTKRRTIYRLLKYVDSKIIKAYLKEVDLFILLTEQMQEKLPVNNNFLVFNGIVSDSQKDKIKKIMQARVSNSKYRIVYTGSLTKVYGVLELVEAFVLADLPDSELIICGGGEAAQELMEFANKDERIKYLGVLSPDETLKIQCSADLLVNPRRNNGEYTKYSFPSKIFEYLITGIPILCYRLDGFPEEFDHVLYYVQKDLKEEIRRIRERVELSKQGSVVDQRKKDKIIMENSNTHIASEIIKKVIDGVR